MAEKDVGLMTDQELREAFRFPGDKYNIELAYREIRKQEDMRYLDSFLATLL